MARTKKEQNYNIERYNICKGKEICHEKKVKQNKTGENDNSEKYI